MFLHTAADGALARRASWSSLPRGKLYHIIIIGIIIIIIIITIIIIILNISAHRGRRGLGAEGLAVQLAAGDGVVHVDAVRRHPLEPRRPRPLIIKMQRIKICNEP